MKSMHRLFAAIVMSISALGCAVGEEPLSDDLENPPAYDDEAEVDLEGASAALSSGPYRITQMSGCATDIGTDSGGTAWITGCTLIGSGYNVYKFNGSSGWNKQSGYARRIAVTESGTVWVVNNLDEIYRRNGDGSYTRLPGYANDIAASDAGVWITGQTVAGAIYRKTSSNTWEQIPSPHQILGSNHYLGDPTIAVGRNGQVYLTGYDQGVAYLYHFVGIRQPTIDRGWNLGIWDPGQFKKIRAFSGSPSDLSTDGSGAPVVDAYTSVFGMNTALTSSNAISLGYTDIRNIAVAANGTVWFIRQGGKIYRATPQ